MKLSTILGNLFLVFVLIQMLPGIIKSVKNSYEDTLQARTKVGIIKIKDAIVDSTHYIKNLRKFFEQKDIKAILLRIESPGGSAGSSQAIFNEIINFKKENPKPVVVLTNDVCASGGYYIACAADYIIATPAALVGSVGSYIGAFKVKELVEYLKAKYNIKQSGKYKTALNPFTENSPEVNEFVQGVTDDVYKQFMQDVAIRRKLSINQAEKWANGKFFTGRQAKELGLVDELGSETNAVNKIKELAMIDKDKKIQWVKPSKENKLSKLFGVEEDEFDDSLRARTQVDEIVDKVCSKLGISENQSIMLR